MVRDLSTGLRRSCRLTEVPQSWRDPSGWRPTPLQMSVDPDIAGIHLAKWRFQQVMATPQQIQIWLGIIEAQKAEAAATVAAKRK